MTITQKFFIVKRRNLYLLDTKVNTDVRFATKGKPKLYSSKATAQDKADKHGGEIERIKIELAQYKN